MINKFILAGIGSFILMLSGLLAHAKHQVNELTLDKKTLENVVESYRLASEEQQTRLALAQENIARENASNVLLVDKIEHKQLVTCDEAISWAREMATELN